jgi:predicted N-formylglutamate amidohydrolase
VPAAYRELFRGARAALRSHRGWDPGALELASEMSRRLRAPLVATQVTRLLVDANRSLGHKGLFSEWSRRLPPLQREAAQATYWRPHRARVEALVRATIARAGTVLHVGVHSFTPRFAGRTRQVDVGLLYDPARPRERAVADLWIAALRALLPELRLRRNQPYRGDGDGLPTDLRTELDPDDYLGFELEVSQRFAHAGGGAWKALREAIARSLASIVR